MLLCVVRVAVICVICIAECVSGVCCVCVQRGLIWFGSRQEVMISHCMIPVCVRYVVRSQNKDMYTVLDTLLIFGWGV